MFLFGGIERLFVLAIHIALSLIVLYSVKNRKNIYLLYAILLHSLVNFFPVIFQNFVFSEIYVFVFAILSIYFIKKQQAAFLGDS